LVRQVQILGLSVLLLLCGTGCTTSRRIERLDRQAAQYIAAAQRQVFPELAPEVVALDQYEAPGAAVTTQPLHLNLRQALALAARHSREYQTSREALFLAAVSLRTTAHDWEWNLTNNLSSVLGRDFSVPETTLGGDAGLGLSHRLISGARVSSTAALTALRYLSGDRSVSLQSLVNLTVTQPLLAGAGPLVAREELTRAERGLVYALRAYVRARKRLVVDVAGSYYGVLRASESLTIARQNWDVSRAARERSEFLSEAGRVPAFQVDQARQDELNANVSLVNQEQAYTASLDVLKQRLGLPLGIVLDADRGDLDVLMQGQLPTPPMSCDEAIAAALRDRLDYATARNEVEDAERAVKIARNAMLPRLDLTLAGSASSPADARLRGITWSDGSVAAGLSGELPLDRTSETTALRTAMIRLDQRRRAQDQMRDQIGAELRGAWRNLKATEQNSRIQGNSVALAQRRVESTELLFEAGRMDMRDVLDARNALPRARDAYIQALVNHRLAWLQLLYDLEQLPTEPETLWSPALTVGAPAAVP
jgi:outer membrane protein TolC